MSASNTQQLGCHWLTHTAKSAVLKAATLLLCVKKRQSGGCCSSSLCWCLLNTQPLTLCCAVPNPLCVLCCAVQFGEEAKRPTVEKIEDELDQWGRPKKRLANPIDVMPDDMQVCVCEHCACFCVIHSCEFVTLDALLTPCCCVCCHALLLCVAPHHHWLTTDGCRIRLTSSWRSSWLRRRGGRSLSDSRSSMMMMAGRHSRGTCGSSEQDLICCGACVDTWGKARKAAGSTGRVCV